MKRKQLNELKDKSISEIGKLISEKRKDLTQSKIDISVRKEKNINKIKSLRRDIAQMLTVVAHKELEK